MEGDFRKTHEWSTGETGAGILERDVETTWKDALTKMFECCFDLLPIMGDRASSQPKFTNANPSDLDADPDDEEEDFHPCDHQEDASVGSGEEPVVAAIVPPVVPPVAVLLPLKRPLKSRQRKVELLETPAEVQVLSSMLAL